VCASGGVMSHTGLPGAQHYSDEELRAIVDEAHRRGLRVADPDGVTATGTQPLCFVDHATHEMRIGYYTDTYARTAAGWRLRTRAMTFIRRNGAHDSGRPHAYQRPVS